MNTVWAAQPTRSAEGKVRTSSTERRIHTPSTENIRVRGERFFFPNGAINLDPVTSLRVRRKRGRHVLPATAFPVVPFRFWPNDVFRIVSSVSVPPNGITNHHVMSRVTPRGMLNEVRRISMKTMWRYGVFGDENPGLFTHYENAINEQRPNVVIFCF